MVRRSGTIARNGLARLQLAPSWNAQADRPAVKMDASILHDIERSDLDVHRKANLMAVFVCAMEIYAETGEEAILEEAFAWIRTELAAAGRTGGEEPATHREPGSTGGN